MLTKTSVPKLYLAGIIPGLLLALLFMAVIVCRLPDPAGVGRAACHGSWRQRSPACRTCCRRWSSSCVVVGSIYAGVATPTEAAALGVMAALVLAAWHRPAEAGRCCARRCEGTMRTTAMIMLIVIAALFLNFVMSAIGLTRRLTASSTDAGLSPMWMLLAVVVFYVILGCFMETLSMMITTIPIVAPGHVGARLRPGLVRHRRSSCWSRPR